MLHTKKQPSVDGTALRAVEKRAAHVLCLVCLCAGVISDHDVCVEQTGTDRQIITFTVQGDQRGARVRTHEHVDAHRSRERSLTNFKTAPLL
jgi:hypothetical protein